MTTRLHATFDVNDLAKRIIERLRYRFNDVVAGASVVMPTDSSPLPLVNRLPTEVAMTDQSLPIAAEVDRRHTAEKRSL
jgi:hypothetical protein